MAGKEFGFRLDVFCQLVEVRVGTMHPIIGVAMLGIMGVMVRTE